MPKKELSDFQLELLQKKRNKDRVKQEQDLRKRVFALGVESNKERQFRIAVAKANRLRRSGQQFQQRRRNRLVSRQRHPDGTLRRRNKRQGSTN
jgi:hypothetical protein